MQKSLVKQLVVCTYLLLGFLLFSPSLSLAQSSPGYVLKGYALSEGGEPTSSTHNNLLATIGQSSPVGISSSDNYVLHAGFWFTVYLKKMIFLPLILKE
jgi:hypothetical protein